MEKGIVKAVQDEGMFLVISWAMENQHSEGWAMYRSMALEEQSPQRLMSSTSAAQWKANNAPP